LAMKSESFILNKLIMNKKLISDDLYVEERLKRMKPVTEYAETTVEELEAECEQI